MPELPEGAEVEALARANYDAGCHKFGEPVKPWEEVRDGFEANARDQLKEASSLLNGVQRYAVGEDPEHPGFSEMRPSDSGPFIRVSDLPQLHKAWAEGLLSEEVVEALALNRIAAHDEKYGQIEPEPEQLAAAKHEARSDLQAAIQATTGEGSG
jgi:hypothetical protein